ARTAPDKEAGLLNQPYNRREALSVKKVEHQKNRTTLESVALCETKEVFGMRHHSFLGIALFIFLVWLAFVVVFHVLGWIIHLLWIVIVIAFVWWLLAVVFGVGRRRRW
ncbi:MAG TPA: hypothetical protein VFU69_09210, partial [Ktedonobacterales bacterium]|nr:hypothetical protein [Ktedonobacterales bacterium]